MTGLNDALDQLRRHRGVAKVHDPVESDGGTIIQIDIPVALPSRAQAAGVSATGVKALESCFLRFTAQWPLRAPRPYLRTDFPLDLPHINPHQPGHLVSPCIFEGSVDEVLHRFGLDAIVDQMIEWLSKAAAGTLIDLSQGWEPTRRDSCPSTVVFSAERAIEAAPTDGTLLVTRAFYATTKSGGLYGLLATQFEPQSQDVYYQTPQDKGKVASGRCAAFIARAPVVDGQTRVVATYRPETVNDLDSLLSRATELGIDGAALGKALDDYYGRSILDAAQDARTWKHGLYAVIILLVKRPAPLVGAHGRDVEVLPYVVRYEIDPGDPLRRKATSTHPAFHEHALSTELLARTSGHALPSANPKMVLLGCGSLGAKVGLHLGRAGFGQLTFVDREFFSPHNMARHALVEDLVNSVSTHKAERMKAAFEKLTHRDSHAFNADAVQVLTDAALCAEVMPADALILDTTASLQVLTAASVSTVLGQRRLARSVMYGQGRSAVLMLEAPDRAVRVDDLTTTVFELCRHFPLIRAAIAGDSTEPTRIFVGDNCRSLTMAMSDATVSRAAAPIALQIERWLADGLPSNAELLIGMTDAAGLGMAWRPVDVPPVTTITVDEDGGWNVRVLSHVVKTIDGEARHHGRNETGGAVVGKISFESRTITIAGLVEAPPDSVRSPNTFILGTEGLVEKLQRAHANSLGHLTFIGTWHSHPMGGNHSGIDRDTLRKIATDAGGLPAVSLVWTPAELRCAVDRW